MTRSPEALQQLTRVVEPKAKLAKASVCNATFILSAIRTVGLIMLYYTFSISLTFYNQRFIKSFQLPLSITIVHLVTKFILAALIRWMLECRTGVDRIVLPWNVYCKKLCPTGIASSLDIGLSNWSFEFITVSLYTMTKSTSIIFLLLFALIFKLEKWRWSLLIVVLFVAVGLTMFTYHSTQFNLVGFLMVLGASVISGVRWSLAQVMTQKKEIGLSHPLDMMYHIQPWMLLGLLPLFLFFEGISLSTSKYVFNYSDIMVLLPSIGLLLAGAFLAFMLEFSEFLLLTYTSGLTLAISGIFKECCTLYLAHYINNDQMNVINIIGLAVCLLGIAFHVLLKAMASYVYDGEKKQKEEGELYEMLLVNGEDNSLEDSY